jgi:hypothetical protein
VFNVIVVSLSSGQKRCDPVVVIYMPVTCAVTRTPVHLPVKAYLWIAVRPQAVSQRNLVRSALVLRQFPQDTQNGAGPYGPCCTVVPTGCVEWSG